MKFQRAFTLIELLVTIAIFGLAVGAVTTFAIMNYRTYAYNLNQARAIDEARKGIETMVKELREAKTGDDGSYLIEKAQDYEVVFYSDIDKDGSTERVRYFVYQTFEGDAQTQDCVTFSGGGSCGADFSDFSGGTIDSAEAEVCVEGDVNGGSEYADIYADGEYLGQVCKTGCSQCGGHWDGCTPFDVTAQAADGSVFFTADGSGAVGAFCDWEQSDHSLKAQFAFSWSEIETGTVLTLHKGVIQPTEHPITYPTEDEEVTILSRHILNDLPVFRYFDSAGSELEAPARLEDTKLIRTHLIININPERPPQNFELESNVQIRNLKTNL